MRDPIFGGLAIPQMALALLAIDSVSPVAKLPSIPGRLYSRPSCHCSPERLLRHPARMLCISRDLINANASKAGWFLQK